MADYTSYSQQQTGVFSGMGWSKRKGLVVVLVVMALLAATVGGIMLTTREAANQVSESTAPAATVTIAAQATSPEAIRAQIGQAVVWRNGDTASRSLELSGANDAKTVFKARVSGGDEYTYVFDAAGTYNYYDSENPNRFSGVIIVE
jgi:plastocyanin